jgi:hypothetical protein
VRATDLPRVGQEVSPEYRAALLLTTQALPAGTAVPVTRETLIALLSGFPALPMNSQHGRMLTAREVGELLGTTERWVYNHVDQLGGKRLSRRCLRFQETIVHRRMGR